MVKFDNLRIILWRSNEKIVYEVGDYEEAAFENTENIDGNLPYLRVRDNNGIGHYYPLEYWETKITGGRL